MQLKLDPAMFRRSLASLFALLMLPAATVRGQGSTVQETVIQGTADQGTADQESNRLAEPERSLRRDIAFLASEELRGRSVTDPSINTARDYLRSRMESIGLQMDAASGVPFQTVSIDVGSEVGSVEKNYLRVRTGNGSEFFFAGLTDGFGPLEIGMDQAAVNSHVVFVGYGITAPEYGYDDYADVDAQGAVVMVLRKEPGSSDPNSPFDGVRNTRHAFFATKIANAIEHGAVAVVFINDPESVREAVQKQQNRIDQEHGRKKALEQTLADLPIQAVNNRQSVQQRIDRVDQMVDAMRTELVAAGRGVLAVGDAGTETDSTGKIPVGSIARDLADRILTQQGEALMDVESRINQRYQPSSRVIDSLTIEMSVDLKSSIAVSDNVIGVLPGKGALADQTVVVGAHYDHVGMGGYASLAPGTIAVHNGADDNASGTAAMLSCASGLKQRLSGISSHRAVLFVAFTGEERGLLGSQYYVSHPVRRIETTVAMVNLDMVGRLRDNELTVYGTGTASGFDDLLDSANDRFAFNLFKVESGYGPSDHDSFYRAGVPVLFFFTGLHDDYHRPSDDFDKIDFGNLIRITDMVCEVSYRLAVLPQRLAYSATDSRAQIKVRRQLTAFLGIRLSSQSGEIRISEVTDGGPASKAGLQIGDEIQSIGQMPVRSTDDVLSWVRDHGPDDGFEIQVRRNASTVVLRGKLEKRP